MTQPHPQAQISFHPQKWEDDYACPVDLDELEGPTVWEMNLTDLMDFPHGSLPKDDSAQSDALMSHESAPQWIKDWDGPYWIEIQNRLEIENYIEAYLRQMRADELSQNILGAMPGNPDDQAPQEAPNTPSSASGVSL